MAFSRRLFLTSLSMALGGSALAGPAAAQEEPPEGGPLVFGCLVDLALCVGCRKCELGCNEANKLPPPDRSFEDKTVLDAERRPTTTAFTVVNKYTHEDWTEPAYNKFQCMHCLDPACASACLVGALKKQPNGPVTYDAGRCMGCRYCMVACPFQIPAYEYDNALAPRIRKCEFCFERVSKDGGVPACVKSCPKEAITFGPRNDLIAIARTKIMLSGQDGHPKYVNHLYGHHEVGGTAWMYVAGHRFSRLGMPALPNTAPPRMTEAIQHGVFKHFIPPLVLLGLLAALKQLLEERVVEERRPS